MRARIPYMATQINTVANEIKRRIMSGVYAPGERLLEVQLARDLNVSRTPIRLAFEELTEDGLLERLPTRGFKVRAFNSDDLEQAIDVRGTLEGMAARIVAERGADENCARMLQECLDAGDALLEEAIAAGRQIDARKWMAINAKFHRALIDGAGNRTLEGAIAYASKIPLASATALSVQGFEPHLEFTFIERAHQDHYDVVTAIRNREAIRAEFIMREHARRSRENKRRLMGNHAKS